MADFRVFAANMRRRGRQVETNANRLVRTIALIADREVVMETPVDTGRARSNWIVSLGSPVRDERPPFFEGSKGSTGAQNAQVAIQEGSDTIQGRQLGQDIWISNNVKYIGKLNEGSSAQAPAGFVEAAIRRAVDAGIRAVRLLS